MIFFRFKDDEDRSLSSEYGYGRKSRPSLDRVFKNVKWGFKKPLSFPSHKDPDHKETSSITRKNIINPQDSFLQNWNKIFLFACVLALAIDPLFFYIPIVDGARHCLTLDSNLEIAASLLRTLIDAFYILHIVFQFRTAYIAPSSRVFGRGELVDDAKAIALKYLSSYFIIDVLSILPLPQVNDYFDNSFNSVNDNIFLNPLVSYLADSSFFWFSKRQPASLFAHKRLP